MNELDITEDEIRFANSVVRRVLKGRKASEQFFEMQGVALLALHECKVRYDESFGASFLQSLEQMLRSSGYHRSG